MGGWVVAGTSEDYGTIQVDGGISATQSPSSDGVVAVDKGDGDLENPGKLLQGGGPGVDQKLIFNSKSGTR